MPTIFSHAIFAASVGKAALERPVKIWFWILTAICAMIPDADVALYSFGVERGSMFAHRGLTHSIVFACLFGALVAYFAERFLQTGISYTKLFIFFSLATLSHPLLDMLTDGGSGVALFAPFSAERFFFPYRPVEVSPIGMNFFTARGIDVIISEIICLWLPSIAILLTATLIRKLRKQEY